MQSIFKLVQHVLQFLLGAVEGDGPPTPLPSSRQTHGPHTTTDMWLDFNIELHCVQQFPPLSS